MWRTQTKLQNRNVDGVCPRIPREVSQHHLCFCLKETPMRAIEESSFRGGWPSTETIADWYSYCREVCADYLGELCTGKDFQIGGPQMTVEIDETLVGKRKYNKGRIRNGKWTEGMKSKDDRKASQSGREQSTVISMGSFMQPGAIGYLTLRRDSDSRRLRRSSSGEIPPFVTTTYKHWSAV
ncbi:hypothetical protein ANN_27033 [Periplaneta americana]|uniref:Transposase n=1 Tax=Periplaneta americana TaxID=6978 RepID=A0ABQ8RWW3_PERAM|nr:hypothetical protein ANN_27033 [Periplaneta americana]